MSEEILDLDSVISGSQDPNQLELDLEFGDEPAYWNFRIIKSYTESGEEIYGIYEVHYNVEGVVVGYTEYPFELYSDSLSDLKQLITKELPKALEEEVLTFKN